MGEERFYNPNNPHGYPPNDHGQLTNPNYPQQNYPQQNYPYPPHNPMPLPAYPPNDHGQLTNPGFYPPSDNGQLTHPPNHNSHGPNWNNGPNYNPGPPNQYPHYPGNPGWQNR